MKRNLPTLTAVLYTSKTLADGTHPIMLRVCYNGQRKYKSIGLSCSKALWNEKKQEVRASHPMARSINAIIRAEIDRANKYILDVEGQEEYTAATIVRSLNKVAPTTITLFGLFEERIKFFKEEKQSHNNATGYRTLLNCIKRFTNNCDLEVFEVTTSWLGRFEEYLRCHYADNSIRKFMDCFKAIMNYAKRQEYIKETPFANFTLSRPLDCRTRKRALSVDEITKLMRYYYLRYGMIGVEDNEVYNEHSEKQYWVNQKFKLRGQNKLTPINAEQFALALFLTSYHFQGLALVDIANLKMKDIRLLEIVDDEKYQYDAAQHDVEYAETHKRKILCYNITTYRTKTHKPTQIVVECSNLMPYLNPFNSYFEEYGQLEDEDMDRYVFPIFDHHNDAPQVKFERMTYMNYMVNVNLKRIAKRLGMPEFTFYAARHSYASNLYHAGVGIGLIAQNMGRNTAEIETYLKEFDQKNILKANNKSLITGGEIYKTEKKKADTDRNEAIKQELMSKGNLDVLERYEAFMKWMEQH